jgi:hypothetical protein
MTFGGHVSRALPCPAVSISGSAASRPPLHPLGSAALLGAAAPEATSISGSAATRQPLGSAAILGAAREEALVCDVLRDADRLAQLASSNAQAVLSRAGAALLSASALGDGSTVALLSLYVSLVRRTHGELHGAEAARLNGRTGFDGCNFSASGSLADLCGGPSPVGGAGGGGEAAGEWCGGSDEGWMLDWISDGAGVVARKRVDPAGAAVADAAQGVAGVVCEVVKGLTQRLLATAACESISVHSHVLSLALFVPTPKARALGLAFWRKLLQHIMAVLSLIQHASGVHAEASNSRTSSTHPHETRGRMARLQANIAQRIDVNSSDLASGGLGANVNVREGGNLMEISGNVRYFRRAALAALKVCVDVLASEIRPSAVEITQVRSRLKLSMKMW